ncbi:uncharacterized protein MONOS_14258 [Monocercomonoides exilis]|uniref:uncharacterized protein n=1 Tax=Monocercomonoides exilis TaxID=2049356 RepID=UPI00355A5818|nr:hypothetical protein MONOS_14258 [Monocercomonoides exilis]|eukprot:MONOS_14258.1-p1 / transcript=MONOS_14258.1 / gene=MONOS_14258 / organism=Monocercomonoides_exilis_PA203 / gene_product=unspecified product / transcript_product=unspecified product / location=Mono_scaffold00965:14566-14966(+) / protein_length=116 / sequence_SO=supercontig / SO=protein_coding / is_pseudo=false
MPSKEASRESAESVMLLLQQLCYIVPEKVDVKISCGSNCTSTLNVQIEYNKQELSVESNSQLNLLWEAIEKEEISFTSPTSMGSASSCASSECRVRDVFTLSIDKSTPKTGEAIA